MLRVEKVLQLIKQRMDALDISQQDVGKLLGLDQPSMSRRMSGKTAFKLKELEKLLPYLGIGTLADLESGVIPFLRLAQLKATLSPAAHREVAMVLRAVADEFDTPISKHLP